jgi:hypothetical protein
MVHDQSDGPTAGAGASSTSCRRTALLRPDQSVSATLRRVAVVISLERFASEGQTVPT